VKICGPDDLRRHLAYLLATQAIEERGEQRDSEQLVAECDGYDLQLSPKHGKRQGSQKSSRRLSAAHRTPM
jgi:hypothetical protein